MMTRATHIQPIATGGRPPEVGHVLHYQILQLSVFGACLGESGAFDEIQCSVVSSRTHHSHSEPNWYIYHSDHLGSSAFLTDAAGDPTQHLQYMPFGESFIEQRSVTSYYTPYTFSAKERDTETGYSYFGARYYDADISVWLSVDPMSSLYANVSPYCYVLNNPIKYIDPWGLEPEEHAGGGVRSFFKKVFNFVKGDGWYNPEDWFLKRNRDGTLSNTPKITVLKRFTVTSSDQSKTGSSSTVARKSNYEKTVLKPTDWITQAPNWSACFTTSSAIVGYTPPKSKAIFIAQEKNLTMQPLGSNKKGVETINQYIDGGNPIIVGVHHTFGNTYNEGTTDHFIVIMGKGLDNGRPYFRFYDVGTTRASAGTHPQNRLYFSAHGLLVGETQYNKRKYTVSQVRPN